MRGSNQDWYNLNSIRSYPFEYSRYELSDKGFTFADSLIVDCMAVVHSNNAKLFLSSIHFSGNIFTATFYDSVSDKDIFMAQCGLTDKFTTNEIIPISNILVSGNVAFGDMNKFYHMRLSGLHNFVNTNIPLINYSFVCVGHPAINSIQYNMDKAQGEISISTIGLLNTLVDDRPEIIKQILQNDVSQKVIAEGSNILFYLSDPSLIKDICPPPTTVCDCPNVPIKKINTVKPRPQDGSIDIEIGEFKFDDEQGKFVLFTGSSSTGIQIENTDDSVILSLDKNSEEICEETKIMPFPDGRLPSEENLI
jgi:hypothetical protein